MKYKILDLFCGAGGASMGLQRAGFDVTGVDIKPQPHYPFRFIQADALTVELDGYDAYWASPPCQHASTIAKENRSLRPNIYEHPNLIPMTRERLTTTEKPYIIENVKGADLINAITLCGSWFGLNLHRHRLFESNSFLFGTPCCHYWQKRRFKSLDKRRLVMATVIGVHGHINYSGEQVLRKKAMGIDWMSDYELTQAIPPAYSEFLGKQLMQDLEANR